MILPKFAFIFRLISIVMLMVLAAVYLRLESADTVPETIVQPVENKIKKEQVPVYSMDFTDQAPPVFTANLELLFPWVQVRKKMEEDIIPLPEKQEPDVSIPTLKFIGMIETSEQLIFSFRNVDSGRVLLFKKGVEKDGITLVSIYPAKEPSNELPGSLANELDNGSANGIIIKMGTIKTAEKGAVSNIYAFIKEGVKFQVVDL